MTFESLYGNVLLASLAVAAAGSVLFADPAAGKGDVAAGVRNGWDPADYEYHKSAAMVVEETTPTAAQVAWQSQPPKLPADAKPPVANGGAAQPLTVGEMSVTRLRFRDLDGADVPALLATPRAGKGPFPVVIAAHGLKSHKAQVIAQVAPALVRQGFAVLAPDLPLHGERPGDSSKMFDQGDFNAFLARMRQAIQDVRQCIDVAEARPELDTKGGVILVGFSMGGILDAVAGPADPRVKAMCLMVAGTVEFPPALVAMVPQLAALQPQLAIPHFAGRPLLMLNATADPIVSREMSDRLYAAAAEPKRQVWFPSGHLLPDAAYAQCAAWVAQTWKAVGAAE